MVSRRGMLAAIGLLFLVASIWLAFEAIVGPAADVIGSGEGVGTVSAADLPRVASGAVVREPLPSVLVSVVDAASGRPVSGARLSFELDGVRVGRVSTGADGNGELIVSSAAREGQAIELFAEASGYAVCSWKAPWTAKSLRATLRMVSLSDVVGIVVDQRGEGVPMCRVAVLGQPGSDAAETDREGRFALKAGREGEVRLLISPVSDSVLWSGPWVHRVTHGDEVRIVVFREDRAWSSVLVKALDLDGNPVLLRECELVPGGDVGSVMLRTISLFVEGGVATSDRVPPGKWTVSARAQDQHVGLADQDVTLLPGHAASVAVRPWRPAQLAGKIIGNGDTSGGIVELSPSHGVGVSADKRFDGMAVVDGDGGFAFDGLRSGCMYGATFRRGASIGMATFRAGDVREIVLRCSPACVVKWTIDVALPADGVVVASGSDSEWAVTGLTDPRQAGELRVNATLPAGPFIWKYYYMGVEGGRVGVMVISGTEDCVGKSEAEIVVRQR